MKSTARGILSVSMKSVSKNDKGQLSKKKKGKKEEEEEEVSFEKEEWAIRKSLESSEQEPKPIDEFDELGEQAGNPDFKSGFVSIIGNANMGKSTLMNAIMGEKLCIVSAKPQTTRHRILGVLTVLKLYYLSYYSSYYPSYCSSYYPSYYPS